MRAARMGSDCRGAARVGVRTPLRYGRASGGRTEALVAAVVWVSENKVFVHSLVGVTDPHRRQGNLERLADLLRGEGLDAQISDQEFQFAENLFPVGGVDIPRKGTPFAPTVWVQESAGIPEIVCIWFAQGAVGALGGTAALMAVKWMRDRFLKKKDEGWRDRITVMIIEDKGEKGELRGTVELDETRLKPVVRSIRRKRVTVEKPDDVRWL